MAVVQQNGLHQSMYRVNAAQKGSGLGEKVRHGTLRRKKDGESGLGFTLHATRNLHLFHTHRQRRGLPHCMATGNIE